MERMPSASTPLMRLPTISRSRSRRITSTSGNSGIVLLRWGLPRPRGDRVRSVVAARDVALAEAAPRDARCRLLRLLLRPPLARAPRLAAQQHRREESLRMVRPLVSHLVTGELLEGLGGELLQAGLVVVPPRPPRALADARVEQSQHALGRPAPPAPAV